MQGVCQWSDILYTANTMISCYEKRPLLFVCNDRKTVIYRETWVGVSIGFNGKPQRELQLCLCNLSVLGEYT